MPRSIWVTDFRLVRDFRAFEIINAFRLPLSLGAFKLLLSAAILVGGLIGVGLWFLFLQILRDTVFAQDRELAWQLCSLAVLYSSATLIGSGLLTSRRLAVAANPHLRLFRDLELPLPHVALRYGVLPAAMSAAPIPSATIVFLVVFGADDPARLSGYAWLLPLAFSAVAAACFTAAWCAARLPRPASVRWLRAVACAVVGLALGIMTTATLRAGILWTGVPPLAVPAITATAILATVGLIAGTAGCVRRARYSALLLPRRQYGSHRHETKDLWTALLADLAASPHGTLASVYYLATITVCAILVGVSPLLPLPALAALPTTGLSRAVVGTTVLLASCVLAIAFERIGPTAKIYHARFVIENGLSARRVAASLLGLYIGMTLPLGLFVAVAAWLVSGDLHLSPLAAAVVVAAAEVAGESLVAPLPSTDGSRPFELASTVAAYAFMTPCFVVILVDPVLAAVLIALYALVLTLGAFVCLRYRLSRLTSNSRRSSQATIAGSPSSAS